MGLRVGLHFNLNTMILKLFVICAVSMALAEGYRSLCSKDWIRFMVVQVCSSRYDKRSKLGELNFAMLDENEINRRFEQILHPGSVQAKGIGDRRLKKDHKSRWKRSYEVNRPQKQLSGHEINREFAKMFQLQKEQENSVDPAMTVRSSNFGPHRFKAMRRGNNLRVKRSPLELPEDISKSAQPDLKSGSAVNHQRSPPAQIFMNPGDDPVHSAAIFQSNMSDLMSKSLMNMGMYGSKIGQGSNFGMHSFSPSDHPYSEQSRGIPSLEYPKFRSQIPQMPQIPNLFRPDGWVRGASQPVLFGIPGAAQESSGFAGSGIFASDRVQKQGDGQSGEAPKNSGSREQRSLRRTEYAGDLLGLPMHYTDIEELVGSKHNENSRRGVAKKIETCCSTMCTVDDFKGLC